MIEVHEARLLDRLAIGASAAASQATAAGVRRARMRGPGLEFHEYRHYQPGDDPRSIDWTVDARLKQLVVRVTRADGGLRVHLLVDVSASMALGSPAKLQCAARLAALLGYVAVEQRDAVGVSTFDRRLRTFMPPSHGRPQLFRMFDTLRTARAHGRSAIDEALIAYGATVRAPGLVVVLSDFFAPGAGLTGLGSLLHRHLVPAVVQVVSREELFPPVEDEVELVDVEHDQTPRTVVDRSALAGYRARLEAHSASLRHFCLSHRLPWLQIDAAASFPQLLTALQDAGLLMARV